MTIHLPARKSRDGHFSFVPPIALKGRASISIWPGRSTASAAAHETSAGRMARWRATQERLLAARGLLADGRTWQQVEEDQQKRTIRIRNNSKG
jgi:hypothetical protein